MKFDLKKTLLDICDKDEKILDENIDLIESGYLDSYAFILLFEALEDAGLNISPTEIKKDDLRSYKKLKKVIDKYIKENEQNE